MKENKQNSLLLDLLYDIINESSSAEKRHQKQTWNFKNEDRAKAMVNI